jgi:hypothetical protein
MSKIVLAEYRCYEAFKIPKGMDLEDKSQVTEWWIKWNKLYIRLVDETLLTIEPEWDNGDGMKEPVEATIEDGEDYGFEDEEKDELAHVASCDKTGCNGGRAFQIRDKTFCSPHCGNSHFGLSDDDEDYWSETEDDCENGNRCEECCYCNRTRPCECGEWRTGSR